VTSIGDYAFYFCENLETIFISDTVTNIGEKAFYGCKNLKVINIPNNITEIKDYTFYGCSSLAAIILPSNLTAIGKYAFYDCYELEEINIPSSVSSIGEFAFTNTNWFHYNTDSEFIVGDGILLKVTPVSQNIVLSSSIRSIVGGAFESAGIEQRYSGLCFFWMYESVGSHIPRDNYVCWQPCLQRMYKAGKRFDSCRSDGSRRRICKFRFRSITE